LPATTGEEALNIARRLSAKVKEIQLDQGLLRGAKVRLSISQGIAVYPYDGEDLDALIQSADAALYHVKETGRGGWALRGDVKGKAQS
ncbi:MAG: diguanylate cyclase, partial [Elusimicrobiota bacterium]|nr:diguanylate cyclase [Elusimicrobiota bacterium]